MTPRQRPGIAVATVLAAGALFTLEALANADKHSAATSVTIVATSRDGELCVAVSDDGRGGAAAHPGSGLEGLADRVEPLGGRLLVDSGIGHGTNLTFMISCG